MEKYPLKLSGVFKQTIWGGTRLKAEYSKDCEFDSIAESVIVSSENHPRLG